MCMEQRSVISKVMTSKMSLILRPITMSFYTAKETFRYDEIKKGMMRRSCWITMQGRPSLIIGVLKSGEELFSVMVKRQHEMNGIPCCWFWNAGSIYKDQREVFRIRKRQRKPFFSRVYRKK